MTIHNPENVPQSAVPSGWRFMLKSELGKLPKGTLCRLWYQEASVFFPGTHFDGKVKTWTYIVPDESSKPEPPDDLATLRDALKTAYEALELIAGAHPTARRLGYQECIDEAAKALKLLQPHVTK